MDRRDFLKTAGLAAVSAIPILCGAWWLSNRGEDMPRGDPYAAEPWQTTNSAGPVLLLINEDTGHRFGRFLAEILWAEGLNAFTAVLLSDATLELLKTYACVVLSAGSCTPAQVEMLAGYANEGGKLVVFQPDEALAGPLGLAVSRVSPPEGRLRVNPKQPLASGIVTQPISVHVACQVYPGEGSEVIAWLDAPEADPGEAQPAVLMRPCGAGMVVAWGYDLAENVVLTRQGNPAKAGMLDELGVFRPIQLFAGWIDFNQMAYPQADEQQRLLANLITWMCREHIPLPRLWYFPGSARCVLVATSDSHRNTCKALSRITGIVESYQGNLTVYYTPPIPSDLGVLKNQALNLGAEMHVMPQPYFPFPSFFTDLRAAGHELTMHPYVDENYVESWREYWKAFTRMGYGPLSDSVRTHDLTWLGWMDAARYQAGFGIRMNLDYYHFGPLLRHSPGKWSYGHFNGSGLPMRFAETDGRILENYQQVTQLADDYFIEFPWTTPDSRGSQNEVEISAQLIQSSLDGNFAAIGCNFHSDPFDMEDRWRLPAEAWLNGTLASARDRGVPIWTAEHWLEFTHARQKVRFEGMRWLEKKLALDLAADEMKEAGLSVLIPLEHEGSGLQLVQVDGKMTSFETWRVGGVEYGLVSLAAGSHHLDAEYL